MTTLPTKLRGFWFQGTFYVKADIEKLKISDRWTSKRKALVAEAVHLGIVDKETISQILKISEGELDRWLEARAKGLQHLKVTKYRPGK